MMKYVRFKCGFSCWTEQHADNCWGPVHVQYMTRDACQLRRFHCDLSSASYRLRNRLHSQQNDLGRRMKPTLPPLSCDLNFCLLRRHLSTQGCFNSWPEYVPEDGEAMRRDCKGWFAKTLAKSVDCRGERRSYPRTYIWRAVYARCKHACAIWTTTGVSSNESHDVD